MTRRRGSRPAGSTAGWDAALKRREWPIWVVAVAVAAAMYVFVWPSPMSPSPSPSPSPKPTGGYRFSCASIGTPTAEQRHRCLVFGQESARRSRPSDFQLRQARQQLNAIGEAAAWSDACPREREVSCEATAAAHTPGPDDIVGAKAQLGALGFADVAVRLAGPDDLIAEEGDLYWAVRNGEACVLGHTKLVPDPQPDQMVTGVLPNGSC